MAYSVSLDPARIQIEVVHRFLSRCYWSEGIREEIVRKAVANSLVVGAYDDETGTQVGFVRVVSDRATFAWVCDVFVVEEHRGHGLCGRMLDAIEAHPELQILRRWCLATRDAHRIYERRGYVPVPEGRWLERRNPTTVWTETPRLA